MSEDDRSEIVFIRKRHGDEEDAHHGGVWKLAFADFMTAMMAFFLVMWLINSTSKETKAAIVQYFNPVQLIDANPAHKGLRDPREAGQGKSAQQTAAPEKAPPAARPNSKATDGPLREAALFFDPMMTLDEIAEKKSASSSQSAKQGQAPPPIFGDPFDRSIHGPGHKEERAAADDSSPDKPTPAELSEEIPPKPRAAPPPPAPSDQKAGALPQRSTPPPDEKVKPDASSLASMRAALDKVVRAEAAVSRTAPRVEVAETEEGVLISLTDDANFSMFAVGSVEPKPELVRVVGQIGRVLAKQKGEIELRGHTDGRSYKSAAYDNWRLSAARANMAYYMLVRGGLAEKRVVKIAGYADRLLKSSKDPLAAVNRRIEILLKRGEH
ncbi:MAG: flagellar motor protein MotB [Methylocystaceae bacterium]|nr:MAG: flagellar motor protein MotB [Methylocystaceae bacterium]